MAAEADAESADLSAARLVSLEVLDERCGVVVEGRHLLFGLELVAARCVLLVVFKDRSRFLKLVVHLGRDDYESVTRQVFACAADRGGDLIDLGVQDDRRVLPLGHRTIDVGPHGTTWSRKICMFAGLVNHDR